MNLVTMHHSGTMFALSLLEQEGYKVRVIHAVEVERVDDLVRPVAITRRNPEHIYKTRMRRYGEVDLPNFMREIETIEQVFERKVPRVIEVNGASIGGSDTAIKVPLEVRRAAAVGGFYE